MAERSRSRIAGVFQGWRSRWWLLAALVLLPAGLAGAEDAESVPEVGLDRLLRLPNAPAATDPGPAPRAGATRSKWQARFREARRELEHAESQLEEARTEIEELAASSQTWQIAAPGVQSSEPAEGTSDNPLSYRLHQQIRRRREEVARAERQLQELKVEANLAGVPQDWQTPDAE